MKSLSNLKNIVIRMPNWLGDFVMALPAIALIRKRYPHASITLMIKREFKDLIDLKDIDLFIFERPRRLFSKKAKELCFLIEQKKFDLGILLTNSFSSAYFFHMAKIKNIIGYRSFLRNFFLTMPIKDRYKKDIHLCIKYQKLLEPILFSDLMNLDSTDLNNLKDINIPKLSVDEKNYLFWKKEFEKFYKVNFEKDRTIVINLFAKYGEAKCWPIEKYKKLIVSLIEEKIYIVCIGMKEDLEAFNEVFKDIKDTKYLVNLIGKTNLNDLKSVIKLSSVVLTNDSGPMHMAAALGSAVIAIFGSTSYKYTGPFSKNSLVISKNESCSPCFKRECKKDFRCMKNISVLDVKKEIDSIFKNV